MAGGQVVASSMAHGGSIALAELLGGPGLCSTRADGSASHVEQAVWGGGSDNSYFTTSVA